MEISVLPHRVDIVTTYFIKGGNEDIICVITKKVVSGPHGLYVIEVENRQHFANIATKISDFVSLKINLWASI